MKNALLAFSIAISGAFLAPTQTIAQDDTITIAQTSQGFERWKAQFNRRATSSGISTRTFNEAFKGVSVNARVRELDGKQSEFTKTVWEYLDSAVSDTRVSNGRQKARQLSGTLSKIQQTYGVDPSAVMAIWGVETNFGSFMGGINVIEALATLAYDGRRRNWAEKELIKALSIIQSGDINPQNMEGSWAGAMGHTQFMPSSYLAYAQDFTRNGKRDIWSSDPTDGLASAANYLRVHGWENGRPRTTSGQQVPNHGTAGLWIPAGANGPAFVVYKNFFVIKRYNNANSYALAVGHLGDRIYGASGFKAKWPRGDRALRRSEARQLQSRLTAKGFSTGGVDGIIGPNTIAAIRAFQKSNGLTPDGYASLDLLKRLQ